MAIERMKSGRDLDELVAERVFGMRVEVRSDGPVPMPPCFSTDIAAAFAMEEKIFELRLADVYKFELATLQGTPERPDPSASFPVQSVSCDPWDLIHASPEKRCLAALKAMAAKMRAFPR